MALRCFYDPESGFILEFFNADWTATPGTYADVVEPGHQYEWAWLLLRWSQRVHSARASQLALELIDRAEDRGVDPARGVAVNALFGDGRMRDAQGRLWPQAERIKALCLAGCFTRQARYMQTAAAAARSLMKYLDTPTPGLWRDTMDERGQFIEQVAAGFGTNEQCSGRFREVVPASSFYHIVSAALQLQRTLRAARF